MEFVEMASSSNEGVDQDMTPIDPDLIGLNPEDDQNDPYSPKDDQNDPYQILLQWLKQGSLVITDPWGPGEQLNTTTCAGQGIPLGHGLQGTSNTWTMGGLKN